MGSDNPFMVTVVVSSAEGWNVRDYYKGYNSDWMFKDSWDADAVKALMNGIVSTVNEIEAENGPSGTNFADIVGCLNEFYGYGRTDDQPRDDIVIIKSEDYEWKDAGIFSEKWVNVDDWAGVDDRDWSQFLN